MPETFKIKTPRLSHLCSYSLPHFQTKKRRLRKLMPFRFLLSLLQYVKFSILKKLTAHLVSCSHPTFSLLPFYFFLSFHHFFAGPSCLLPDFLFGVSAAYRCTVFLSYVFRTYFHFSVSPSTNLLNAFSPFSPAAPFFNIH